MTARAISPGPDEVSTAVFAKRLAGRLAEEVCRLAGKAGLWVPNHTFRVGCPAEVQGTLMTTPSDPLAILRSKSYLALLVLAAIIGVPVTAAGYSFLALVSSRSCGSSPTCPRSRAFTPNRCGGRSRRWCWPLSPSGTCQVRAATRQPTGSRVGAGLPGIVLAAFATLSLGVALGPETPMIALGGALGVLTVRLVRRDAPPQTSTVMSAAGRTPRLSSHAARRTPWPRPAVLLRAQAGQPARDEPIAALDLIHGLGR
jgi:hypothetical protein